jgi:hypothetical protein
LGFGRRWRRRCVCRVFRGAMDVTISPRCELGALIALSLEVAARIQDIDFHQREDRERLLATARAMQ